MSASSRAGLLSRSRERVLGWRRRARRRRRVLTRRLGLDRWYPHVLIALTMAPLGVLLAMDAAEGLLGADISSFDLAHFESRAPLLETRRTAELALGLFLVAMSVGVALRSRLAWLWSLAVMGVVLFVRLPIARAELPLTLYFTAVLGLLLIHRSSFVSRSVATSAMFAVVSLATFLAWAVLSILRFGAEFDPPVLDVETALYLTVVTVSTVGFGDITPKGEGARLLMTAMIPLGIGVAATSLSAVLVPLLGGRLREILGGRTTMDRSEHYVVVGHSPLARNATMELEKRSERVTLVLEKALEDDFYRKRDVVLGDPTDLSVLRSAGAEDAKGVLALSADDSTNGFVVLGVNELDATIPTVAALNDPANEFRLRRTQPSLLLSLQALGGELLAMALTGEHVDVGMLSRVLELHGSDDGDSGPA